MSTCKRRGHRRGRVDNRCARAGTFAHVGPSVEAGLTAKDAEDVLVAFAPIVGAPRAASAAVKIAEPLDLAISFAIEESGR